MLLIGAENPDWVRVPDETPHPDASKTLRVKSRFGAPCPKCYADDVERPGCWTYDFEGSELLVAECLRGHGFIWYRMQPEESYED